MDWCILTNTRLPVCVDFHYCREPKAISVMTNEALNIKQGTFLLIYSVFPLQHSWNQLIFQWNWKLAGSPLLSVGEEDCGNNRKDLCTLLVGIFLWGKFLTPVLLGCRVCQHWRYSQVFQWILTRSEVRQESLKLFGLKHFKCLIFDATDFLYVPATWIPILSSPSQSALPYARSSLWAISKPLTSCLSALLAICSPALAFLVGGQTSTDSTHVWACCQKSLCCLFKL